jgi:hypothetical protein
VKPICLFGENTLKVVNMGDMIRLRPQGIVREGFGRMPETERELRVAISSFPYASDLTQICPRRKSHQKGSTA